MDCNSKNQPPFSYDHSKKGLYYKFDARDSRKLLNIGVNQYFSSVLNFV